MNLNFIKILGESGGVDLPYFVTTCSDRGDRHFFVAAQTPAVMMCGAMALACLEKPLEHRSPHLDEPVAWIVPPSAEQWKAGMLAK